MSKPIKATLIALVTAVAFLSTSLAANAGAKSWQLIKFGSQYAGGYTVLRVYNTSGDCERAARKYRDRGYRNVGCRPINH